MNNKEFVAKIVDIAKNYKTLYVMGCFGAPMTPANKTRYCNNHSYNKKAARQAMIKAATADTFGFDCVNLIKGVLWGWNGDKTKTYGGAKYAVNGVPFDVVSDAICFCFANKREDTDWVHLPVANFDCYYSNTNFSKKWLSKIPDTILEREVALGICRVNLKI